MTFQLQGLERKRPVQQIERLLPRHFKILDLVVAGHNTNAIAEVLGMSRGAVGLVIRSPLFQAELARRRNEDQTPTILALDREAVLGKARSILEGSVELAAQRQVDLLGAQDPAIQLRASSNILERVLGAMDSKTPVVNVTISAEQVALLNLAIKESTNGHVHSPRPDHATANGDVPRNNGVHETPSGDADVV